MSVKSPGNGGALSPTTPAGTNPAAVGATLQWVKVGNAISHTAFQTAATTNTIPLFTLAAGGVIHGIKIKHSVPFTGGAITAYTLSVGIIGTLAKYASAFDVFQAASNTAFQLTAVVGSENNGAGVAIQITATSTTANLSASTAGTVDVYALISVAL